jgi:hypothetical protein
LPVKRQQRKSVAAQLPGFSANRSTARIVAGRKEATWTSLIDSGWTFR